MEDAKIKRSANTTIGRESFAIIKRSKLGVTGIYEMFCERFTSITKQKAALCGQPFADNDRGVRS